MALKPGIVFRVQHILDFLFTFFTKLFVIVAIPEICERKFKATLSPFKIFAAFPSTIAIKLFFLIVDPSFFLILKDIFLSINPKVSLAKSKPPTTHFEFVIILALIFFLFCKSFDVISPFG